jgi:hypothetical protein
MIIKTDIYLDIDTLFINTLNKGENENDIYNDLISSDIRTYKCWEPYQTEVIIELFKKIKNKEFIHVGAHIGYYSIIASAYNFNVNSFENNNTYYEILEMNTKKNNKITIHNNEINKNNIYNIFKHYDNIGLIKFNNSGYEPELIYGLSKFINNDKIDCIITEISTKFRPSQTWVDLINFLLEKYNIYDITDYDVRYLDFNTNHTSFLRKFNLDLLKNDSIQNNILCIRKQINF